MVLAARGVGGSSRHGPVLGCATWSPRVPPAPPRAPCAVHRWCSAADPILSQGLKYSGFPAAVVSLSHSLTSSLLPSRVSPSGVRARCLFVPRKGCTLPAAARQLVVRRCCVRLCTAPKIASIPLPCVGSRLQNLPWETWGWVSSGLAALAPPGEEPQRKPF